MDKSAAAALDSTEIPLNPVPSAKSNEPVMDGENPHMNQESSEIIENVATSLPVYSIPTVPPPIMPNVPSDPAAHVLEPYPMPKPTPIHPISQCIRIKRSYQNVNSMGSYPEFEVAYPSELSQHQIDENEWRPFILRLNQLLKQQEQITWKQVLDGVLGYLTANLYYLCLIPSKSYTYNKERQHVEEFIRAENQRLFEPRNLNVISPHETAYLFLEIRIMNR